MSDEETPLQTNRILMATGFTQLFSDSLNNRFNNLLVAAAGATVNQMGFLQGAKSLSANLTQLLSGQLSDRYGKRRFISAGRILNALAITALLLTDNPGRLIWLVILSSFGNGLSIPSWNSLLGDYTTQSNRGRIIGAINAISQLGSFTAMVIAILISINQIGDTTTASYHIVLALAAATSLLSGILILRTTEKPLRENRRKLNISELFRDPKLTRYLALNFLYGAGMSFAWPLFPMVITHRLNMRIWQISTLSLTSSLVSTLSQRRLGNLMDNIGRKPIITMSRLTMAIAPITYALATQWWHIAIGELFLGFGMAAWMSSESTYIIDLAPGELRATYLASSTAAFGVASFIGSNLGGYIIDTYFGGVAGLNKGLFLSSALRIIFGLAYFTAYESKPETQ
ncbi:MFS transporter [Candidatus Bathyarchaeota archaeon]|nr:MFS transporter [Candidatus Bathyarchaeota archaeon]